MADKLSSETTQRIEQLVQEIAGSHKLNDELCRELQGHIEDKLLGYMRGEETVTEADAFVLAREHFGDKYNLRELLGVERPRVRSSRLRLVVFICGGLLLFAVGAKGLHDWYMVHPLVGYPVAAMILSPLLWLGWRELGLSRNGQAGPPQQAPLQLRRRVLALAIVLTSLRLVSGFFTPWLRTSHPAGYLGATILGFLLLFYAWRLLLRWKTDETQARWYERWHPWKFLAACLLLLLADVAIFHATKMHTPWHTPRSPLPVLGQGLLIFDFLVYLSLCGALCVWWCNLQRASRPAVFHALMLFAVVYSALREGIMLLRYRSMHWVGPGEVILTTGAWDLPSASDLFFMLLNLSPVMILFLLGGFCYRFIHRHRHAAFNRPAEAAHD